MRSAKRIMHNAYDRLLVVLTNPIREEKRDDNSD